VRGTPDEKTGYIVGIQEIDAALRSTVLPAIDRACLFAPSTEPAALLPVLFDLAASAVPRPLESLTWTLTPTYKVEMTVTDRQAQIPRVMIRQRFDFAAAHRLHSRDLTDQANRDTFGKCNNPSGHGHNYQIEPTVVIPASSADSFELHRLESIVERSIVEPFDHKHLNIDTPEFDQSKGGVIPSVEHIAMVCFDRLAGPIRDLAEGAELVRVTVWETDRTSCTYPA
jgi:6-pyruvoyltetrahydropterin/6-carboxytetrahydropterin synthase